MEQHMQWQYMHDPGQKWPKELQITSRSYPRTKTYFLNGILSVKNLDCDVLIQGTPRDSSLQDITSQQLPNMPSLQAMPLEIKRLVLYHYIDGMLHCDYREQFAEEHKCQTIVTFIEKLVALLPNLQGEVVIQLSYLVRERAAVVKTLQTAFERAYPAPEADIRLRSEMQALMHSVRRWRGENDDTYDLSEAPSDDKEWRELLIWETEFAKAERSCRLVLRVSDLYSGYDDARDIYRRGLAELWRRWWCDRGRQSGLRLTWW